MANSSTGYLNNNNIGPELRDWQHAARMFSDNNQVYGPKQNFLFHVAISINQNALATTTLGSTYRSVLGMLVKSVGLPRFTVSMDKVNQYNRKKNIQRQIAYEDATVKFHDDNMGLINLMWQNYFNYYYSDSSSAAVPGAFDRTATKNFSLIRSAYGLDSGSTAPFFNYITIYQMSQGQYVSYKLINPLIASWNHEDVSYASSQNPHENTMTLSFEAVEFGSGVVANGDPEGFGQQNYDQMQSPLSGLNSISNTKDINTSPTLLDANMVSNNSSSIINNAIKTVNNYQNTNSAVPTNASSATISTTPPAGGVLADTAFPGTTANGGVTATTIAKPSQLTGKQA